MERWGCGEFQSWPFELATTGVGAMLVPPKRGHESAMADATKTEPAASGQGTWFTTTHWSLILNAQDTSSPVAAAALEMLCRDYWYPLDQRLICDLASQSLRVSAPSLFVPLRATSAPVFLCNG